MQLPDEITSYNGLVVASVPALCLCLKCHFYPYRYGDLVFHFAARPISELSIKMEVIYGRSQHLLSRYNHNLLSPQKLLQKYP